MACFHKKVRFPINSHLKKVRFPINSHLKKGAFSCKLCNQFDETEYSSYFCMCNNMIEKGFHT